MRAANLGWALGTMLALAGCGGGSGTESVSTTTAAPDAVSPPQDASGGSANAATGGQGRRPVTLSWQLPDQNEDGSRLVAPPKVRVHYGRESRRYDTAMDLPQPGARRHVFTSLTPGTWYLAVTSVGSDGIESEFSDEAVAVVN